MRKFKDKNGREWVIDVTVSRAKAIRDLTGFDILQLAVPERIEELASNPYLLLDTLYYSTGADEDVDPAGFLDGFDGNSIDAATIELVRAIADFFGGERAKSLHRVLDISLQAQKKAQGAVAQSLDAAERKLSATESGEISIEPPESAESIPVHSPAVN